MTLLATNFNLNDVQINNASIIETNQAKNLKLGFTQSCISIFQQLCSGYSNQPQITIKHIRQSLPSSDGQLATATTIIYYQLILNAARPFATQHTYAISICNKFIQGLDWCFLGPFRCFYPNHSPVHNLTGPYQHSQIPIIRTAAEVAKD
jgi:hypothetical protein